MRRLALIAAVVLVVMAIAGPATAKQDKEWVCHMTHSLTNPIVLVHVAAGWDNGHGSLKGSDHQDHDPLYHGPADTLKAGPLADDLWQYCGGEGEPPPQES